MSNASWSKCRKIIGKTGENAGQREEHHQQEVGHSSNPQNKVQKRSLFKVMLIHYK